MEELAYPIGGEDFVVVEQEITPTNNCNGNIKAEDRGDVQYARWYLISTSDKNATVTVRLQWFYNFEQKSQTRQYKLYPCEEMEVFVFPRYQRPEFILLACSLS